MKRLNRIVVTTVPVITLFMITITTLIVDQMGPKYDNMYMLLSHLFGYGLFWLPGYFYMWKQYKLCDYTFVALCGLALYSMVNIIYIVLPLHVVDYITIYESTVMVVASIVCLMFMFRKFIHHGI